MPRQKKRLEWTETAWREFIGGIAFIAEDSPHGASLVKARIDRAAVFVHSHPRMGRPGGVTGTREYPVPRTRYTLIYEEGEAAIYILHCWHQSRNRAADHA
jgi:plasmid stabilization system protein ParE